MDENQKKMFEAALEEAFSQAIKKLGLPDGDVTVQHVNSSDMAAAISAISKLKKAKPDSGDAEEFFYEKDKAKEPFRLATYRLVKEILDRVDAKMGGDGDMSGKHFALLAEIGKHAEKLRGSMGLATMLAMCLNCLSMTVGSAFEDAQDLGPETKERIDRMCECIYDLTKTLLVAITDIYKVQLGGRVPFV